MGGLSFILRSKTNIRNFISNENFKSRRTYWTYERLQQYFLYYLDNPVGVPRVWLKGQNFPGLAMTRSFGDLIAAGVGVTNIPEIKCCYLLK